MPKNKAYFITDDSAQMQYPYVQFVHKCTKTFTDRNSRLFAKRPNTMTGFQVQTININRCTCAMAKPSLTDPPYALYYSLESSDLFYFTYSSSFTLLQPFRIFPIAD